MINVTCLYKECQETIFYVNPQRPHFCSWQGEMWFFGIGTWAFFKGLDAIIKCAKEAFWIFVFPASFYILCLLPLNALLAIIILAIPVAVMYIVAGIKDIIAAIQKNKQG